jgi:hypothetical protein
LALIGQIDSGGNPKQSSRTITGSGNTLFKNDLDQDQDKKDPSRSGSPPFDSPQFLDALRIYESHRKALKKPMTPDARRLLFLKLEKWGEASATAALLYSTEHGWIGCYREEDNEKNKGNRPNSADTRDAQLRTRDYAEIGRRALAYGSDKRNKKR